MVIPAHGPVSNAKMEVLVAMPYLLGIIAVVRSKPTRVYIGHYFRSNILCGSLFVSF
jgi:hypothetical protein